MKCFAPRTADSVCLLAVTIEQTLKKLQAAVRTTSTPDASRWMTRTLPDDLATDEVKAIVLDRAECEMVDKTVAELEADPGYEHLTDTQNKVLRFVADATTCRSTNHVPAFVQQYARPVEDATCIFTVLHLNITERMEIGGVLLLPSGNELIPDVPEMKDVADGTSYISVPCRGTNCGRMAERARERAEHALGLLRIAMDQQMMYHRRQLGFRIGDTYVLAGKQVGWQAGDVAHTASLDRDMYERVMTKLVTQVPLDRPNGLQKQVLLAIDWINRGFSTSDRLVAMLYQFFALEALLGDTAGGLKSYRLAFRRTMLAHVTDGGWVGPELIYDLYDKIRSTAVHGSEPPVVTKKAADSFETDVIRALEQYLTFAAANGFTARVQLRRALVGHADVEAMLERLRGRDSSWDGFVLPTD